MRECGSVSGNVRKGRTRCWKFYRGEGLRECERWQDMIGQLELVAEEFYRGGGLRERER